MCAQKNISKVFHLLANEYTVKSVCLSILPEYVSKDCLLNNAWYCFLFFIIFIIYLLDMFLSFTLSAVTIGKGHCVTSVSKSSFLFNYDYFSP